MDAEGAVKVLNDYIAPAFNSKEDSATLVGKRDFVGTLKT